MKTMLRERPDRNILWRRFVYALRQRWVRQGFTIAILFLVLHYFAVLIEVAKLPRLEAMYETLALFAFAGDKNYVMASLHPGNDLHSLRSILLWLAMIFAPIATIAAVVELLHYVVNRPEQVSARWNGHLIIVGAGRLGTAIGRDAWLRHKTKVAFIEIDPMNALVHQLRTDGFPVIIGDGKELTVLQAAGLDRASAMIAVAREDLTNISSALMAVQARRDRPMNCIVHIVDDRLSRRLPPSLRKPYSDCLIPFDSYSIAARALISARDLSTSDQDSLYIIGGFGRFGQSMLRELMHAQVGRKHRFWVVDPRSDCVPDTITKWKGFNQSLFEHKQTSILDERLWSDITSSALEFEKTTILVCTDNDDSNLAFSLAINDRMTDTGRIMLLTRMFKWPDSLLSGHDGDSLLKGIYPVNVFQLLAEKLRTEVDEWPIPS